MTSNSANAWKMSIDEKGFPKCAIFDFDGVILESVDIKTEAFIELFSEYPEHQDAIVRYHLENLGISRFHKFDWIYSELLQLDLDETQSGRLGASFSEIVLARILSCPFVAGAPQLLRDLQSKCLLFVASGTPQEELDHIVESRGIKHHFTEVCGTPRSKVDIISSIQSRFHLANDETLFIGDGMSDYAAAEETGIRFLARQSGSEQWDRLDVASVPDLWAVRPFFGLEPVNKDDMVNDENK